MGMMLLDGEWSLACDPENVGRRQQWWRSTPPKAKPVRVPGVIQEVFPAYHGVAWYWQKFMAPTNPDPHGRYLIRFWAVDYVADVWLNDVHMGCHEGGETPFTLDVTSAIKPNTTNRLAVRVLNPTNEPIDGIVLSQTPHRNKTIPHRVGGSYNSGGIMESVELLLTPAVRVEDIFVKPDSHTGDVHIHTYVNNAGADVRRGHLRFSSQPGATGPTVAGAHLIQELPPGDSLIETQMHIEKPHLWDVKDPFLYRVTVRLWTEDEDHFDELSVRYGFREFRVERGYFRLNGRRVFLRSTHTANHCPVGQIIPPRSDPSLLRRDLLFAKASGFNMVRFIAGVAHPWQLDMCDELGLMVYQETMAGWELQDSPQMRERFDRSIAEMIRRDRNHPSVVIWGLLNEVKDGPVFRHAEACLDLVLSLDETRLVLLDSGRWDGQFSTGSICNPGSHRWEQVWGDEGPDYDAPFSWGAGGYVQNAGDAHVYPVVPLTCESQRLIRTLGRGVKPVFLSEYGIGSLLNAIHELRKYEESGEDPDLEDASLMRSMAEKFITDWNRLKMDGVYPFPEDMLRDSQSLHCRQRLLGFDLIRSNPRICGYNLTGMLDHAMSGEGLWTFWREWKPGIVDALTDGWAPLRWCLFVGPMHAYVNRPIKLEVILANEDLLSPGEYPVSLRVSGPDGPVWDHRINAVIPPAVSGEDGPLAVPVFLGEIKIQGPPGSYEFAVMMEKGGAPAGGRLRFFVSEPPKPKEGKGVILWGIEEMVKNWLISQGISAESFKAPTGKKREVIVVGSPDRAEPENWRELMRGVARGSVAIFLDPKAFNRGENALGWLPLKNKGREREFRDWLYHKECVARDHPVFEGLQRKGIMDWDYYGPVIPHNFFEGQDTPDDVMAAAFAIGYPCPGGYACGLLACSYSFGEGAFILNTLKILENLGAHPAADRLLLNIIDYAASITQHPAAPLPPNFETKLKDIGYV